MKESKRCGDRRVSLVILEMLAELILTVALPDRAWRHVSKGSA